MGSKVIAIILLVVGLGVGLYLVNSGGIKKIGSIITPPPVATTTVAGQTTTSTATSTTAQATSTNAFYSFLNQLFHPGAKVTGPGGLGGNTGNHSTGGLGGSGSTGSTGSGAGSGGTGSTLPPVIVPPSTASIPTSSIPNGLTRAQLSPDFHMIRFNGVGVSQIGFTAPGTGSATTTIDITGWKIQTNRGGEYIPQAVNIYQPSAPAGLNDIVLTTRTNDIVYMYSNTAPVNVRLNECMGFLNATHQFNPSLPSSCPAVDRSAITTFTGQCQNYILSLGCQPANMSSQQIPRSDYACQQFLQNNFTYTSCVSNHAADTAFLTNQWRVWMGSSPLDRYHDNVQLLDRNGLVVDTYSY